MSVAGDISTQREILSLRRGNAFWFIVITVVAVIWQQRWGTVSDTSWLITVGERMLAGERLYIDIYETNPPFSVWLYMPAIASAGVIGVSSEFMVHAWTYLLVSVGFLMTMQVIDKARFPEKDKLASLAPALYAILVIFPGNAFSEREHIGAALFLPLLALMAWRAKADAPTRPSMGLALLVGLSGSILLLVKPYYALMVLAPALFVCWRHRSFRPLFAIEHWVIGVVCLAYLASVLIVHPEFLRDVLPVVSDVYMKVRSYRSYLQIALMFTPVFLLAMFINWRLWPTGKTPELASVATVASMAGFVCLVLQGKGWPYHAYPALLCVFAAILCLLALPSHERRCAGWTGRNKLLMKPGATIMLIGLVAGFGPLWPTQQPGTELLSPVRAQTSRPSVALIGSDLAYGHPFVRLVEGHWAETYVSDWLGVAAVELTIDALRKDDRDTADHYRAILDRYSALKRAEYMERRPDIIVVQKDDENWFDYLVQNQGFDDIMPAYFMLAENNDSRVYLRRDYGNDPNTPPLR